MACITEMVRYLGKGILAIPKVYLAYRGCKLHFISHLLHTYLCRYQEAIYIHLTFRPDSIIHPEYHATLASCMRNLASNVTRIVTRVEVRYTPQQN